MFGKLIENIYFSKPFDTIRRQYYKEAYEQGKHDEWMETVNKFPLRFTLNQNETKKFDEWKHNHECRSKKKFHYSFIFTGTGIGDSVEVECKLCKEKENLTDFSDW